MNPKAKSQFRVVDGEREHSRDYARRKVRQWRSNAERDRLPVSNVHDDKGAEVLDVDRVINASLPNHTKR